MRTLVFDVETTTFQKGNPHARRNKMVVLGARFNGENFILWTETPDERKHALDTLVGLARQADRIIGHNLKFDIKWIRRWLGFEFPLELDVWDTGIAHYIATRQRVTYPSLEEVCGFHGVPGKLDVVRLEYWDKGIDTDAIPREVLGGYLSGDLEATARVYDKQVNSRFDRLVRQSSFDARVLAEMEWNGLHYNVTGSLAEAYRLEKDIAALETELQGIVDPRINWGSYQQVATVLYGGTIEFERKETYLFAYKDKRKASVPKTRTVTETVTFPRLVQPLKRKGKESLGTDEGTLQLLDAKGKAKEIISLKLRRAKLSKLVGTYYRGLPETIEENDWDPGVLHPNLNQTRTITGRLSSDNPNEQNLSEGPKRFIVSRYDD